jgi:hypothetical protein
MAKKPLTIKAPERPTSLTSTQAATPVYELSTTILDAAPTSAALPPEADTLSGALRDLAVRFIGTRRRLGEALLEAARYMSEARAAAEEGQWYIFLRVTSTSPDSAGNLINIHHCAAQHPAFAEKIRSGWLNQTVAGELAKPTTSPEVLAQLLGREDPLRVADVKRARKLIAPDRDKNHIVDNPNYSGSLGSQIESGSRRQAAVPAQHSSLAALLDEVATRLEAIAVQAYSLPSGEHTIQALSRIEQATAAIRQHVPGAV